MAIHRTTLKNGLKIVHNYNPDARSVTVNVLYGVGSRNEDPDKTGIAHQLEHLMFCDKDLESSFESTLEELGARSNAFTSSDITNFYTTIPPEHVELAFKLESERMRQGKFTIDIYDAEHKVVVEEFKQKLSEPYGDLSLKIHEMAYKSHPYRWCPIGRNIEQVEALTFDDVCDFYNRFYAPNNAILSISGDLSWKDTLILSNKWFGNIDSRSIDKKPLPKEKNRRKCERVEIEANVPHNTIVKAYPICGAYQKNFRVYDIITDILANDKSSRMPYELTYNRKLFNNIDAYISTEIDYNLLFIIGMLNNNVTIEEGEKAILDELNKLCNEKCTDEELEHYRKKQITNRNIDLTQNEYFASVLAKEEFVNQRNLHRRIHKMYDSITTELVMAESKKLFSNDKSYTLIYHKKE